MRAWLNGGSKQERWSRELSMLSKRKAWYRLTHAIWRNRWTE